MSNGESAGRDQRKFPRVPLRLEVRWDAGGSRISPDVTTDVSMGGCYVESLSHVSVGSVVKLQFHLPWNASVSLEGEVLYHHPTVGFGIKFRELTAPQVQVLKSVIEDWEQRAKILAAAEEQPDSEYVLYG